jgi:hypothetical protein
VATDAVVQSASTPTPRSRDRPTGAQQREAIIETTARFTEVVRTMPAPRARVDDQWSCSDVAAHVGVVVRSYSVYLSGDATPLLDCRDLSGSNAQALRTVPSRDPATRAAAIDDATAGLRTRAANFGCTSTTRSPAATSC